MRIIERGTPPTEQPIEGRCRNCRTIFEFMRNEATFVPDQRDGNFWMVVCPVCNENVTAGA